MHFHEVQRFRQGWVWLVVIGSTVLTWAIAFWQLFLLSPADQTSAENIVVVVTVLVVGIGIPVLFWQMRLITKVTDSAVTLQFVPLQTRKIALTEITHVEARTYAAIREYGGWGLRGFRRRKAFTISGDQGVELTLASGQLLLIGSQRANELAAALQSAMQN